MGIDRMTLLEQRARHRFLLQQGRELIRAENDIKIKKALTKIMDIYTARIGKGFDPVLSSKIDVLTWLLEN